MIGRRHRLQDLALLAAISAWSRTIFSRQRASLKTTRAPFGSMVSSGGLLSTAVSIAPQPDAT
jgi:hypothetical protein